jgi:glutathione peroxidase
LSTFDGNVLLIVNVASNCGLTKTNYIQLPKLADEFGQRGFKILAFPCNQFGGQEPGSADDILQFVKKFDVQMTDKLFFFEKGDVNGSNTRDVYKFIKPLALNFDNTLDLRWNFRTFFDKICFTFVFHLLPGTFVFTFPS